MKLNLPLALTIGRVAVIPVVAGLFYVPWEHARHVATMLFAAASITDWFDGYLARKWNQTSRFGAFLDPVADKLLVGVALVMIVRDDPKKLLAIMSAIIIGREIAISALREWLAELGQRVAVNVSSLGKVKTGFQMVAIGFLIWDTDVCWVMPGCTRAETWRILPVYGVGFGLLVIASVLTLWSMVIYLRAAWPYMQDPDPTPPPPPEPAYAAVPEAVGEDVGMGMGPTGGAGVGPGAGGLEAPLGGA